MQANVFGYVSNDAPAVLLRNKPYHNATRGVFNRFHKEIAQQQGVKSKDIDWTQVSPGQAWRLAEDQFAAAQVPRPVVDEYFRQANKYMEDLGKCHFTQSWFRPG